ncbi:kinase-like domain-containing protein [Suillus paluster]|uniref:kinase-like domain-containing protein n=1 Tax=Suillus paluster TaxID=48578 RepID=UPI001B876814|nr:kinase-like domain-containing protein [Suillus paluster]KAG1752409.1 kinase-like domain-containing protein [Suillus paluster]
MATYTSSFHLNPASGLSQALQSTPLPWLAPAFNALSTLINILARAESNKNGMRLLEERCLSFLAIIKSEGEAMAPDEKTRICLSAQSTIQGILERMTPWCLMSRVRLFAKQDELAGVIQQCHLEISDCLNKLQITSHLEIHRWQSAFEENQRIDNEYIVQYLGDLRNTQELLVDAQMQQTAVVHQILTVMQENLGHVSTTAEHGLQSNLYNLLQKSRTLLPNMDLKRGEVKRTSNYAVNGTSRTDVWEGCYLNEEKVAIRVLRAVYATPKTLKRFKAEAEIWRRIFEADKGAHILTIYGFCQSDGDYPYTVSPWMSNGTLNDYVNEHPEVDHRYMLKGVAEGMKLLHSMSVVHGDIKGINIVISPDGRPLLSNFGFTRLEEEIMSYFDVSNGSTLNQESLRWCPAELCRSGGKRTMASDVYAFSMTALELMTHEEPWVSVRLATQVILKVCQGETPRRPTNPVVAERGLDDALWALLEKCWCTNVHDRLTMNEIVNRL